MNAKVEGADLVIRIPLNKTPEMSASGKSRVVASTHGNAVSDLKIEGKPVVIGLNAYIKAN